MKRLFVSYLVTDGFGNATIELEDNETIESIDCGGGKLKKDLERLVRDFKANGKDRMHFDTWECNISIYDDRELEKQGYNLIYQGFNSHDCCNQFTIEKVD